MSWLKDLEKALVDKGEPVPKGWVTARQAAKEWGIQRHGAIKRLRKATKMVLVEVRKFKISTNGTVSSVPHYYKKRL